VHEERDVDLLPEVRNARHARAMHHARVARQSLDAEFAASALKELGPSERRELLALLLSPSLDLRIQAARVFATEVFAVARVEELSAAALVRGAEAAARSGRTDLIERAKQAPADTVTRAASLLELVAGRLERQGDAEAAKNLRVLGEPEVPVRSSFIYRLGSTTPRPLKDAAGK
jgi:hypothetical protein